MSDLGCSNEATRSSVEMQLGCLRRQSSLTGWSGFSSVRASPVSSLTINETDSQADSIQSLLTKITKTSTSLTWMSLLCEVKSKRMLPILSSLLSHQHRNNLIMTIRITIKTQNSKDQITTFRFKIKKKSKKSYTKRRLTIRHLKR